MKNSRERLPMAAIHAGITCSRVLHRTMAAAAAGSWQTLQNCMFSWCRLQTSELASALQFWIKTCKTIKSWPIWRLGGRPTRRPRPSTLYNIYIKNVMIGRMTTIPRDFLDMIVISVAHAHNFSEMFTHEFLACHERSYLNLTLLCWQGMCAFVSEPEWSEIMELEKLYKHAPERLKRHDLHAAMLDDSKIVCRNIILKCSTRPQTSVA